MAADYNKTRRHPRYELDVRLQSLKLNAVALRDGGRVANISEGGMAVLTPAEMQLGDTLEIEFKTPNSAEPLCVRAVLRNRNGFRYGLEFLALSHSQRREILRLCQELTPQ